MSPFAVRLPPVREGWHFSCFATSLGILLPSNSHTGAGRGADLSDLGDPIVCAAYDLAEALRCENAVRIAREDAGLASDDDDDPVEVEDATRATNPGKSSAACPPVSPGVSPELTGQLKKKQQKRRRERAKRKATAIDALNSVMPPVPTPRVLEKAAASVPVSVPFSAEGFRATKQRWTGLAKPVEHPLLAYAHDPETLKKHMQYVDWDGKQCHVILDRKGHVIGVLVCPPAPGETWDAVVEAATAAMRAARDKMSFPPSACSHRRGNFPAPAQGFAFGGGRRTVGNIKALLPTNQAAMDELLEDESVRRMATYPVPVFQSLCFPIYSDYHRTKQTLLQKNPHLRRTFPRSPFAVVTVNLGPVSVSLPHTDAANKADGMCLIAALGAFDPDKGGHLRGEDRFSLIQYSAGALFRWVANGFRSDLQWAVSATAADLVRREEERALRCSTALQKFTRWKDVKVKNFTGRARWEIWDQGDIADFSDLTEESEGEELPPQKRKRRA
ncbi:hypothetical protein B0H14DRAFT_2631678 [Mycena olivaceomarginata]|nr:hypothetical protein B0H14DRAFT_2631678 [Mycena olivaceomarginata]